MLSSGTDGAAPVGGVEDDEFEDDDLDDELECPGCGVHDCIGDPWGIVRPISVQARMGWAASTRWLCRRRPLWLGRARVS